MRRRSGESKMSERKRSMEKGQGGLRKSEKGGEVRRRSGESKMFERKRSMEKGQGGLRKSEKGGGEGGVEKGQGG